MRKKSIVFLAAPLALLALLLTSCAAAPQDDPFQAAIIAPYVNPDLLDAYTETLPAVEQEADVYRVFSYGGEEGADAMADALEMKVFALVANHELDVMICDLDYAAHCARGDFFYDFAELFTPEELAPYEDRLLSFPMLDIDGNPTDEQTAVCGIDVSDNEALQNLLMGADGIGAFIVSSTDDLPLAEAFFWSIVNG